MIDETQTAEEVTRAKSVAFVISADDIHGHHLLEMRRYSDFTLRFEGSVVKGASG